MASIKEIKQEFRHREWAEQIRECQNSGNTVKEWCESSCIRLGGLVGGYVLNYAHNKNPLSLLLRSNNGFADFC